MNVSFAITWLPKACPLLLESTFSARPKTKITHSTLIKFQVTPLTSHPCQDPVKTPCSLGQLRVIIWCRGRRGRHAQPWICTRWSWM